ncbi:hypothetical protein R3P38DRAFT_2822385 [Favolaschia claudopus]|uniref:Uncharacterized protein n=1 Tax=Favolaschia claudopus TaxID=2862362 RepID=A0AAW0EHE8_9AGAR
MDESWQPSGGIPDSASAYAGTCDNFQDQEYSLGDDRDDDERWQESESGHELHSKDAGSCDVAEDILHAILVAQVDAENEQNEDTQADSQQPCSEDAGGLEADLNIANPSAPFSSDSTYERISRPSLPHGPSSFAVRVQKKLELAATTRLSIGATTSPLDINAIAAPESSSTCERDDLTNSGVSSHQEFSDSGTPACASNPSISKSTSLSESQAIGVNPDTAVAGMATFPVAARPAAHRNHSLEQIKEQLKPRRPLIAAGMSSAGSVKDKIRELEERVRATEGY